jgi:hypothetical protein
MRRLVIGVLFVAACNSKSGTKAFDTFDDCFIEFNFVEKPPLTVVDSVVECCLNHDIAMMKQPVCGDTQPDCINFLAANLAGPNAGIQDRMDACTQYIDMRQMMGSGSAR